jgi:diguanylate cyclase (GGDEF)-like protein
MEVPSARIWAIAEGKDGAIWAGGVGGLYEYAAGRWKHFKKADGLSNLEVLSLGAGPDGAIWVGYRFGGGIDRVHGTADGIRVERGVERRGTSGIVYFLAFDANGRLWAGTERGVDMWDGSRWSHYDVSDGLAWDDCNLNAFAAEADGTVWIGTSGGLSRFKPRRRTTPDTPADVVFTQLSMGKTDVSGMSHPSFEAPSNSLSARYSALNAPRQNAVVFRYRLEGANSAWMETGQHELQFARLAPGDYKLEVEAQDNEGLWTSQPAAFPFSILTAWYASWWLICICVLTPVSAAAGVLRWRMVSAQRRERELVRLVKEKTVDLQLANEELQRLSYTDSLTGLANRRIFDQTIEKECSRVVRMESVVSLLLLDVDHFKDLNDSQGHQRGDECLVLVAAKLSRMARRPMDLAARYGGEEFALILPGANSKDAVQIAEAVRLAVAALQLPHPASPLKPYLTVSVGVATAAPGGWTTPEELIAAADRALYAAKHGGRNRTVAAVYDELPVEPASTPHLNPA